MTLHCDAQETVFLHWRYVTLLEIVFIDSRRSLLVILNFRLSYICFALWNNRQLTREVVVNVVRNSLPLLLSQMHVYFQVVQRECICFLEATIVRSICHAMTHYPQLRRNEVYEYQREYLEFQQRQERIDKPSPFWVDYEMKANKVT